MNRIDVKLSDAFPQCCFSHKHKHSNDLDRCRKPRGGYLVLQLHDELIYEISEEDVLEIANIIKYEMENAMKLSVRMPVKVKTGTSWGRLDDLEL